MGVHDPVAAHVDVVVPLVLAKPPRHVYVATELYDAPVVVKVAFITAGGVPQSISEISVFSKEYLI